MKDRSEALYHCITNIYIPTTTSSSQSSFLSNHNNDHPFSTSFIYKLALATISHENNTTTTTTTTTPSNNNSSSTNIGSPLIVLYTSTIRSLFITLIQYYPSIYISSVSSSSSSSPSPPTFSSGIDADYEVINGTDLNYNWLKKYISSLQHQQHSKVLKLHSCKIITELLAHDLIIYNNRNAFSIDVNTATSNTSLETSSSSVSDQQSYSINHLHSTVPISSSSSTTAVTEATTTTISTDIDIDGRDNHVNNLSKISLICASSSVKYTVTMLINMLQDGDHLMRAQAAVAVGNISKIIWKLLQMYPINCLLPHIKTLNTATIHENLSLDTDKNHIDMIQNSDNKNSLINIRLYMISLLLLNMKDKVGSVRASSYKSLGDCILNNILIINYSLYAATAADDDHHKERNSNLSDYQLNSIGNPSIKTGDYQLISTILAQFLVGCHDSNLTVRIQAVWATGR